MILRDGRRRTHNLGPSRARCAGFGGTLAAHAIPALRSPWAGRRVEPHKRMENVKDRPRCGKPLPRLREPCYRRSGHRDICKSMAAVIADTDRRRIAK